MSDNSITALLADDHPLFRDGLRFALEQTSDIAIVAEAADGLEAVRLSVELDPDIVIMDIKMPHLDGLAATRQLAEQGVRSRILVLTMYEDDENVLSALKSGASGYLLKGVDPEQIVSAVRAVASGHAVFGPALATRILGSFSHARPARRDAFPELSAREREVLTYIAEGLTNQEIAKILFISPITVRNHVSNILMKLQLTNRRQAMLRAREAH